MKYTSVIVTVLGTSAAVAAAGRPEQRSALLCGQWSVQHGGPVNACGASYSYTAGDNTACASNGSNCLDICCTPKDPQLCGEWSVEHGGPINACGSGYSYTATDEQVCAAGDGSGCQTICCTKQSEPVVYRRNAGERRSALLCGEWSVQHGGPVNSCGKSYTYTAGDNTACASNGSNCLDICCTPNDPQLCGEWSVEHGGPINACGTGYSYKATDEQVCAADGSGCQTICCTKQSEPVVYRRNAGERRSALLCGEWSVQHGGPVNSCGKSYTYTAGDNTACASNGSNCLDICCTPKQAQLCGNWSVKNGGPINACGSGYKYTATDEQVCAADGSGCQTICCSKSKSGPVVYRRAA